MGAPVSVDPTAAPLALSYGVALPSRLGKAAMSRAHADAVRGSELGSRATENGRAAARRKRG